MRDYEKGGLFYLGREIDPATHKPIRNFLYESKHFTTHAFCVGMTGSGKTGLGIAILEEAGIDKIPAIIIDPKGDLSNLFLTFPELAVEDFAPWVEEGNAEEIASRWKEGLTEWGEDGERIKKLRESVDLAIYTPASEAGTPISILSSFASPSKEELLDPTLLREKILSTTASLLGLIGIDADPVKSREYILISMIIQVAWQKGENLDIPSLIRQVQTPPFERIGAMDVDTFYSSKERLSLSIQLNNLLASPSFQAWMEGVPLDIEQLLYSKNGKPKLSIISIAHLSDTERMFFVTLLLNAFISWMRRQPGTSSLRALLYMDEIFGFFPPVAMPPSKIPMLTLLKQARAYGIGIMLSTQNPVDIDYKGLSNCGTWFIGKLQTERDRSRVLDGLNIASNGEMNAKELGQMLEQMGKRLFILRSIYEKKPILFETRWTLSYLKGPLTLTQIASLGPKFVKEPRRQEISNAKPVTPPNVEEYFFDSRSHYEPRLLGIAKVHYIHAKSKIDHWEEVRLISDEGDWENGESGSNLKLVKKPSANSTFGKLPAALAKEKNYALYAKQLASSLYQNKTLIIYQIPALDMVSMAGESESEFRMRASLALREKRDELVEKVRDQYRTKMDALILKIQRAQSKAEQKKQSALWQKIQTGLTFLFTLISAFFSRRVTQGTITQTGTSMRKATKMTKDSQDAILAEGEAAAYQKQLEELESNMHDEIAAVMDKNIPENVDIESITLRPRKSDIIVEKVALLWF